MNLPRTALATLPPGCGGVLCSAMGCDYAAGRAFFFVMTVRHVADCLFFCLAQRRQQTAIRLAVTAP